MHSKAGASLKAPLALGVLAAPALAEAHARDHFEGALASRGVDASAVHIGPLGFHASNLQAQVAGRRLRLGELTVRPSLDGLRVAVDGVELLEDPRPAPAASPRKPEANPEEGLWRPVEKARRLARRLGGVPVSVSVRGPVDLNALSPRPELLALQLDSVDAELRSDGSVEGEVHARAQSGGTPYQLEFDFETHTDAMAPVRATGEMHNETLGQIEVKAEAAGDRFAARVDLEDGRMELRGQGLIESQGREAALSFQNFPVGDLATFFDARAKAMGVDVSWDELVLEGAVHLNRDGEGWRADARDMTLRGLRLQSPRIGRQPVQFDELGLEADLRRHGSTHSAVLTLSHQAADVVFSGHYSDEGLSLSAELAPIACQDFLAAAPRGLFPLLEGMQMSGRLEGQASLSLQWATLHNWVAEQEAAKAEGRMPDESTPAPGMTEFHFPLLESCRVTREAPGLSVERVKGAYRHRFQGGDGREHQRVLAPGAPNFSPMSSSREFSRAFTILEDARFWVHDGFDREHIERALWHDLSVGAMARGASTITQQTARNLWLGLDRSVSRKLQEAFLAARLERDVGKRRIMEIYMNIIELGPEVYGIEQAAQFHFGRPARDLNLLEALHIASLAPSPVRLSKRFENGEIDDEWRAHLEEQVRRLRIHGFLSREEARAAKRLPVALLDRAATPN